MAPYDPVGIKIRKLMAEGKPHKQAIAMALNMQREGRLGPRGGYIRTNGEHTSLQGVPAVEVDDYTRKHWGERPDFVYESTDTRLPEYLQEMGKLQIITVRALDAHGGDAGTLEIDLPDDDRCILAYDRRTHRLYCVYPEELLREMAQRLWQPDERCQDLSYVARELGRARGRAGRHEGDRKAPYPRVRVQSLGPVESVIYWTHKQGDGPSRYKHSLGENSGKRPDLCVSRDGALWWAGGNYTVEKHGIID